MDFGRVVVLNADFTEMALNTGALITRVWALCGWPSGYSVDSGRHDEILGANARSAPMTETFPLEKAQEAYERMMSNNARFLRSSSSLESENSVAIIGRLCHGAQGLRVLRCVQSPWSRWP